jgi:L-methionine (R)-S-oxide reductase
MDSEKETKYKTIISNLDSFYSVYNVQDFTKYNKLSRSAKMALVSTAIKKEFPEYSFVGFYTVYELRDEERDYRYLEIGPYSSDILPVPKIDYNKGVCGSTWAKGVTQIVNNVAGCNNYIACSPDVKSEIVIPVYCSYSKSVQAVLDIDSTITDRFDETDQSFLELIVSKFASD